MADPLVSVCMITYNHEPFIARTIESVLSQKTDFPFEVVIGEDFSTDGTRKICKKYQERYPQIIKLLNSDKNLGVNQNLIRTLKSCKGKYIATLEGDDYWTDPLKLQKQVDLLETHSKYNLCFTNCSVVDENNVLVKKSRVPSEIKKKKLKYYDLLYYTPPTLTVVCRNNRTAINVIEELGIAYDHVLFFLLSRYKDVFFLSDTTGVHLLNTSSVYHPLTPAEKMEKYSISNLDILKCLINNQDKKEVRALYYGYAITYARLFLYASDSFSLSKMLHNFSKLIQSDIITLKPLAPVTLYRLAKRLMKRIAGN
ncbi:MAG: hypothetical protein B6D61_13025 [Bacteroidetes bacterium 4484_249]|nr:MAG: hypothetical protein B6D61_13025 [Bacteroidetes bacterium 4484_249]RKY77996.1 MAG: hypothetical protein DRQ07_08085 [candidate division KSB1 bacterium]